VAYQFRSMAPAFAGSRPARVGHASVWLTLACALSCSSDKGDNHTRLSDAGPDAAQEHEASTPESGTERGGVTPAPEDEPFTTLAEWHLFSDARKQTPAPRVVPYEVISQLFADYATKYRFLYVPDGALIGYSATATWDLPVGTILVKTFSYLTDTRDPSRGERLLETRLLVHESAGWAPHTYVWNQEQTSATLKVGGDIIDGTFIDASGSARTNSYIVPSENDCRSCHGRLGHTDTLGGRTRQLDRDHDYGAGPENQLDHLARLGLFDRAPEPKGERVHLVDPLGTAPVPERVRSYFDGNCAHCHRPGDFAASSTGFWLDYESTDPLTARAANWGLCKQPTAAGGATCGHQFDLVPGSPDDSILVCRVESTLPKVRMPPVGRNLVHAEGAALIREWIQGQAGPCGAPATRDAGTRDGSGPLTGPTDAGKGVDGPG
jgi:uncharacterized repeat protein (TIGR03806 family)